MAGCLFCSQPAATEAARTLGQRGVQARAERAARDRKKVREMTNRLRADMRAKGLSNLPEIDWSKFT